MRAALERIKELRKIAVGDLDLSWLAPDRLKKLARHAGLTKAYTIRRLSEPRNGPRWLPSPLPMRAELSMMLLSGTTPSAAFIIS
ncbi:MAG: hypothetical protein ACOC9V_06830 [Chloroflexota bacterium]